MDPAGNEAMILAESRSGVGILTLNRPDKLNAWTPQMGVLYFDLLEKMAKDPEIRAILVTGKGRGFCAGADVNHLSDTADAGGMKRVNPRDYWYPLSIGKPIIAAIHGPCLGVGFQVALTCDLRFIARDAKLGTLFATLGLIAEAGTSWLLPRIVGTAAAMDLLISGRIFDGAEAKEMGLAARVAEKDELFDLAFEYCARLASACAPSSMRTIKEQIYGDLMQGLHPAFERSKKVLAEAYTNAAFAEGIQAFKEKRKPSYPPLDPALAIIEDCPWR